MYKRNFYDLSMDYFIQTMASDYRGLLASYAMAVWIYFILDIGQGKRFM